MNDIIETTDQKKDKGFTLIELLIVIVILGILATVTVFAVSGITNQGRESACAADLKTIEVAIETYVAQEGGFPASRAAIEQAGFLRPNDASNFTLGADGSITGVADTDCEGFSSQSGFVAPAAEEEGGD